MPTDDSLSETAVAKFFTDHRCNFTPKGLAEFFVDTLVAHDGELM